MAVRHSDIDSMNKKELREELNKVILRFDVGHIDAEVAHIKADCIVRNMLERLGEKHMAKLYEKCCTHGFWYS